MACTRCSHDAAFAAAAAARGRMRLDVFALITCVNGHAIMVTPAPRAGTNTGRGIKLSPFESAAEYANFGCGGANNNDPGVEQPAVAFSPGEQITVSFKMTTPHPLDALNNGVRIAIHYGAADSFLQNILAGGVEGDPNAGTVAADGETDEIVPVEVTLPNKACDYCTLQWIWSADRDGGSYIGCADISITSNGQLPNFANVPSEVGNILPGVPQSPLPPGVANSPPPPPVDGSAAGQNADGGGGNTAGAVIGVLVGLAAVVGFAYWWLKVRGKPPAPGGPPPPASANVAIPPPPPPPPVADLPPGWAEGKDPNTQHTYYYNASTGQTQWIKPERV